jgi:hypothetical protein
VARPSSGDPSSVRRLAASHDFPDFTADIDIASGSHGLIVADRLGVAVAKLARIVVTPAAHASGIEQRARVAEARRDLAGRLTERGEAHGRGPLVVADGFAGSEVPFLRVTERPALPPAPHLPRIQQSARMIEARDDIHDPPQPWTMRKVRDRIVRCDLVPVISARRRVVFGRL